MPSNDELIRAAEELIKFNADWHYYYTPGQSIGNPVKVPWGLYQQVIKVAYHVKSTLAADHGGEQVIDEKWLADSGWEPEWNDWWSMKINDRLCQLAPCDNGYRLNVVGAEWPITLTIRREITALLTALAIDKTTTGEAK